MPPAKCMCYDSNLNKLNGIRQLLYIANFGSVGNIEVLVGCHQQKDTLTVSNDSWIDTHLWTNWCFSKAPVKCLHFNVSKYLECHNIHRIFPPSPHIPTKHAKTLMTYVSSIFCYRSLRHKPGCCPITGHVWQLHIKRPIKSPTKIPWLVPHT